MNRQQEERCGEGDIVDDARALKLPHQERFSPLIKAEEGQHAGEEAAVDGVFQQVQHPEDEVRAERKNRRRHLIFCAAGDEQVQREECAALQDEAEVRHRHFRRVHTPIDRHDRNEAERQHDGCHHDGICRGILAHAPCQTGKPGW